MIIEVRPTPALRRYRARIAGAAAGVAMVVGTLVSVATLADTAEHGPQQVPYSEPIPR